MENDFLYRYCVGLKSGKNLTFDSYEKIDFHTLKPGYIVFNDLIINLSEVEYIRRRQTFLSEEDEEV